MAFTLALDIGTSSVRAALFDEVARLQAGTPGKERCVLPFWSAERAPEWDELSKGSIHGITLATQALDLLQRQQSDVLAKRLS